MWLVSAMNTEKYVITRISKVWITVTEQKHFVL